MRRRLLAFLMLVLCPIGSVSSQTAVPVRYTVTDLGKLPHVADEVSLKVNDAGQVSGWADAGDGVIHACLWTKSVPKDLGTLTGFMSSMARGLNRQGQAVGWCVASKNLGDSLAATHASLFSRGKVVDLGTLGGRDSKAFGINSAGWIVGVSQVSPAVRHAFLYKNGKMTDLGSLQGGTFSLAYDINDQGQIVGIAETAAHAVHGFLWQNGKMADLGALPDGQSSLAYTLNNQGQIAGSAETKNEYHAVWKTGGPWIDLGTLGSDPASVRGINAKGRLVGASNLSTVLRHAFLYAQVRLLDLNTLIPAHSDWTLLAADSINSFDQIACVARTKKGETHAVLLTLLPAIP